MILTPDQLAVVNGLRSDAERDCTIPGPAWSQGAVAVRFVTLLRELEGSGAQWVAQYLDHLTVRGAYEVTRDARRRKQPGRSRRGNPLPATVVGLDAHGRSLVVPIEAAHRADIVRARDEALARGKQATAQAEAFDRLIERMDADGADVVGDLAEHLEAA